MFVNCSKNFVGISKNKYDYQTRNTLGIIYVKEKYGIPT